MTEPALSQVDGVVRSASRARLLAAAINAFAENGYERTRVQDVARRAGLTTGSIYSSFTDKGELLTEAVDEAVRAQDRTLDELATMTPQALEDFCLSQAADWVTPEWAPIRALLLEAHAACRREPRLRDRLSAIQTERVGGVSEFLAAQQSAGALRTDVDAYAMATLLFAMTLGVTMLDAADVRLPEPEQWRGVVSHVVDSFKATP
jgi:AcrR family transcriptional regulator